MILYAKEDVTILDKDLKQNEVFVVKENDNKDNVTVIFSEGEEEILSNDEMVDEILSNDNIDVLENFDEEDDEDESEFGEDADEDADDLEDNTEYTFENSKDLLEKILSTGNVRDVLLEETETEISGCDCEKCENEICDCLSECVLTTDGNSVLCSLVEKAATAAEKKAAREMQKARAKCPKGKSPTIVDGKFKGCHKPKKHKGRIKKRKRTTKRRRSLVA